MPPAAQISKNKIVMLGALIGAAVGVTAALLLIQRAARNKTELKMGLGEGVKLGVLALGLLRQVSQLGEGD